MEHHDEVDERVAVSGLQVAGALHRFITDEALPGSGVSAEAFWDGLAGIVDELGPRCRRLLETRAAIQAKVDQWHRARRHDDIDMAAYRRFLHEIGYIEPEGPPFEISATGVDPEIAEVAGPQLIVPVMNARYALNAANARWGSLYDALYGTDALGFPASPGPYDPERGAAVIAWARGLLDDVVPLVSGSHAVATGYLIRNGELTVELSDGSSTGLRDPTLFAGFAGSALAPSSVLLRHHGLHIEIVVDRKHPVGKSDAAGVADVVLEAAVTAIMDCEDSVAAVDADDKVVVYRNWLGLMRGDLSAELPTPDSTKVRRLAPDRQFTAPDGSAHELRGRALMLVRNVGHLMTTDAILDRDGNEVSEGILDAIVTVLAGVHDLRRDGGPRNSPAGSVYVVKPKMHGAAEVALADELFTRVEAAFELPQNTVKMGLMDEERRTSVNLSECIRAASARIAFINTGFLDRTGDEIHTSMEAGPMVRKADMRNEPWLAAYEGRSVAIGLACGLRGRAQIGKGMWAAPDLMGKMLEDKIAHPMAGASCAWVPSPTAATLHATHYHRVDVWERQRELAELPPPPLEDLLTIPISKRTWTDDEIQAELENNAQGVLGYVVRWVNMGIGCSKVPDIHGIALMEDRATCRISSQHIANWLRHGVIDHEQLLSTMERMAAVVDGQNATDPSYEPMAPALDGFAFQAACDLIMDALNQPYTEPALHRRRHQRKTAALARSR